MDARRFQFARLANLLVPGAGLIALRREWLGLSIAVLFAVAAQLAVCGLWIVPADFPRYFGVGAAVAAVVVWSFAQWLTWSRIRALSAPELARELEALREQAAEALDRSDREAARRELLLALSVDDESVATLLLWARLLSAEGSPREAQRAWRRVIALGAAGADRTEAEAGLARA